jgi:site-specific DNA recombinase
MTRFAFYGRVSTEDQQDPESSKGWQMARARALIEPGGGKVVAEFFDIGQSRSLPWKRRPEAARLLAELGRPDRGFEAVVIGEPQRAFSGNQFGLTFPVFVHWGVQLWVPEVGGQIEPDSDAHEMVMNLYGGMSKGERNRIKIRVRSAMASQAAIEGRFLGGRPPYGYQLGDAGAHPNPGKAAIGQRLHRLELDPTAAPTVERIFAEYLAGQGLHAIAEGLTADGIPSPSGHDPARNRHRVSTNGAWSKSAIRAILQNPRYTGRQVWNRQRRDETLIDVDDVGLGHETKMRWNDRADWVWSAEVTHTAIVDPETFAAAQLMRSTGEHRRTDQKKRRTTRPYMLRSLVFCGLCHRRMEGTWNNGRAHYRCRYAAEYALAKGIDHPRTLYLREDKIIDALDEWLASIFDLERLDATLEAIAAASVTDETSAARAEAARRKLADCDHRLDRYRSALEADADPTVVASWIAEVNVDRLAAERELQAVAATSTTVSEAELRDLIGDAADGVKMLGSAGPGDKAELYAELGVRLTFEPGRGVVVAEATPCTTVCVGGGTCTLTPRAFRPSVYVVAA